MKSIRFADFELDLQRQSLSKRGLRLKIQPQPLELLALLIEAAPQVVSRDKIKCHIWGENTHIEADQSINFCIRQIRAALSDDPAKPRYLQTVPREGYRFIGAVEPAARQEEGFSSLEQPESEGGIASLHPLAAKNRVPLARPVVITGAMMLLFAIFLFVRSQLDRPLQVRPIVPITTDPGVAQDPAMSPNGAQLAFSWQRDDGSQKIYIRSCDRQHQWKLTLGKNRDRYPAWSPDGKKIAFLRLSSNNNAQIVTIPAGGGEERVLRQVTQGLRVAQSGNALAWTANNGWLCFTELTPTGINRLRLLSTATGALKLLDPEDSSWDESSPAFSPDGRLVAYERFHGPNNTHIVIRKLNKFQQAAGEQVVVANAGQNPSSPAWLEDGTLAFISAGGVMQASFEDPFAKQIYAANAKLQGLAYDRLRLRLITSRHLEDIDIWILPLRRWEAAGDPKLLIRSSLIDEHPAFSPDGKLLAFASDRSGAEEVWIADSDGRNQRQMTHLGAYIVGFPHWSPDGKFIVFHARVPKTAEVYLLRVADNALQRLVAGEPGFTLPSFSSDGKSVYCVQEGHGEELYIYRVDIETGTRERLWPGIYPAEIPGRDALLYLKPGASGVFERSFAGSGPQNSELRVISESVVYGGISPVHDGFFYSTPNNSSPGQLLRFYSFDTKQTLDIARGGTNAYQALSISPDRARLAFDIDAAADNQLVAISLH